MTRCAWLDHRTGERVCLRRDRHQCEVGSTRLANRCTRTDEHYCQMGRHLAASRPARLRPPWRFGTARRPMVSHPPKPHPVRDAVLGAWIVAWLVGFAAFVGVVR